MKHLGWMCFSHYHRKFLRSNYLFRFFIHRTPRTFSYFPTLHPLPFLSAQPLSPHLSALQRWERFRAPLLQRCRCNALPLLSLSKPERWGYYHMRFSKFSFSAIYFFVILHSLYLSSPLTPRWRRNFFYRKLTWPPLAMLRLRDPMKIVSLTWLIVLLKESFPKMNRTKVSRSSFFTCIFQFLLFNFVSETLFQNAYSFEFLSNFGYLCNFLWFVCEIDVLVDSGQNLSNEFRSMLLAFVIETNKCYWVRNAFCGYFITALLSFYQLFSIWKVLFKLMHFVSYRHSFAGTDDAGSFNNSVAGQQVCNRFLVMLIFDCVWKLWISLDVK